uniref:NADH dehydrogenase subunit 2 n=1 Tax=Rotundella rotunda TaxID=1357779 RepID=A0A076YIB0_9CHLO|nr:NADH dehydrogenase subunit 2 [Rotundella rotunda]
MTLDVVCWAPEAFFSLNLLVFLWYGTGAVVSPVTERVSLCVSSLRESKNREKNLSLKERERLSFEHREKERYSLQMYRRPLSLNLPSGGPSHAAGHMSLWAVTLSLLRALLIWNCPLQTLQAGGVFVRDVFSQNLGLFLWIVASLALWVTIGWQKKRGIIHTEYVFLALLSLFGQHLLLMSTDLMALYLCLELQSFSLVVLCALNYTNPYAIEAGMKYFLLSAFRSCLLLLGIGLIYWQTGHTRLSHLRELLSVTSFVYRERGERPSLTLWLGLWLVGLGLLWKLAAAPLHLWAADVYMGAWSSVTLWISTLPKIAVLGFWTHTWHPIWTTAFGSAAAIFSGLSLLVGAFAPLAQTHLKRLLAFSSIGHMGLMLMCLSGGNEGFRALWAHMGIYIVTSLAVWSLYMWPFGRPKSQSPGPQYLWDLAGLNHSSPVRATAWAGAMVSLRGLPPLAGFLGKLGLFWWRLNTSQYVLLSLALLSTVVSTVYYLRVLKISYVDRPQSWSSYGPLHSSNAYMISRAWVFLCLLLWHGTPILLRGHLLALRT